MSVGKLLEVVGLAVDPGQLLGRLRTSERKLVEVAKALAVSARVLIMDEPTAALSQHEVNRLFEVVDSLRKQRVPMMFVSHWMLPCSASSPRGRCLSLLHETLIFQLRPSSVWRRMLRPICSAFIQASTS